MNEDPSEKTWGFALGEGFEAAETLRMGLDEPDAGAFDLSELEHPELVIKRTLGSGGMGVVSLAVQERLKREVAVKHLHATSPAQAAEHLVREAWLTGALEHPNIVPVHDVLTDAEGEPQIVLKRIEGASWQSMLDDPALLPPEAKVDPLAFHLTVLSTVCRAVEFAHERGVLHRDLKPDNVMLGRWGEVYLLDWGVAVAFKPDEHGRFPVLTEQKRLVGTPLYMAPEMFERDVSKIGPATDVYLLAGVLFRILSGKPPRRFTGSIEELYMAAQEIPDLDESWASDLRALLLRSFARDVEERPSTEAFRSALQLHLSRRGLFGLLARAQERLQHVQSLVKEDDSEEHRREVYAVFSSCRFGLEEVLEQWPENTTAAQSHRDLVETMLDYELKRGDSGAAMLLLGMLDDPQISHVDAVKELDHRAKKARLRLVKLNKDLDSSLGFRTRIFVLGTLGHAWVAFPGVVFPLLQWERGYDRALLMNLIAMLMACAGALLMARSILWSKVNQGFLVLLLLSPLLGTLLLGMSWKLGFSIYEETILRAWTDTCLILLGGLLLDRRLLPSAFAFCGATVFGAFFPLWIGPAILTATVFLVLNGLVAWSFFRTRHDHSAPML